MNARALFVTARTNARTARAVLQALRANRMAALIPVAIVLFAAATLLYFVHLASPLAPFVYSLF